MSADAARDTPSPDEARQAAARHLMETADSHPGTAASVLLDRLAQSRAALADLLAATAEPSQVPPVLLPFATRWVITRGLAWTAEQRSRNALRVVMGHDPDELAGKLAAIESEADPAS